jgi:signal recognition particle subunit SRP54
MLDTISGKFSDILRTLGGKARISEKNVDEALEEIKLALLEADVNLRVVRRFINRTLEEAKGDRVLKSVTPGQQFTKIIFDRMVDLLGDQKQDLVLKGPDTTSVLLVCGLQGSGKTTTTAKLALHLRGKGRRPLMVAADLARPAAVEQLIVLGGQTGVPVYHRANADSPLTVVREALEHARLNQYDTVLVDTAGRLQVDQSLMDELKLVREACRPDEVLLVADAMSGQAAADVARTFDEKIGLSGIILSKFDSDARGGAALSLKSVTGKPVKFIGTGEKIEDLEPFFPERIASRILGMGDIVSLVEKAQAAVAVEEAEELQDKMESATFSLQDYLDQFRRVRKMGSMQSLLEMIPGLQGKLADVNLDEKLMKKEEAIILSMTPGERLNYRMIGPPRRRRIARGSGTSMFDVNQFIKKFEKTRLMMRKVARNKNYQNQLFGQASG